MTNVLEFDSIELMFETRSILSSVYVRCETGEVVGILGRNGTGKSVMMKIVFGAQRAQHKSVRINGEPQPAHYLNRRHIGYLPQAGLIPAFISIRKALKLFGINEEEFVSVLPEAKDFISLFPAALSGGYLRLVEALLILKSKTLFCILDEPFSGLMPLHVEKLKAIIREETKTKGVIITDHLYRDVLSLSDRAYLLVNGKTYAVKDAEDLLFRGYLTVV